MESDLAHIAVPFRMQPGLRRLDAGARHLTALDPDSPLFAEKQRVCTAGCAVHAMPGFAAGPALASIQAQAERDGIDLALHGRPLALSVQQDLAVLELADASVPWMCICVPSGWAPEEKLGASLAAIHAPVADNAALTAALPHIVRLLGAGACWERHVWTISPSDRHDQHPQRHPAAVWPDASDPERFARRCFLRSERQTFFPVRGADGQPTSQVVFTITLTLRPLTEAVAHAPQARHLHDALASMSDAVLAYKRLTDARAPLLAWLAGRASDAASHAAQPV